MNNESVESIFISAINNALDVKISGDHQKAAGATMISNFAGFSQVLKEDFEMNGFNRQVNDLLNEALNVPVELRNMSIIYACDHLKRSSEYYSNGGHMKGAYLREPDKYDKVFKLLKEFKKGFNQEEDLDNTMPLPTITM